MEEEKISQSALENFVDSMEKTITYFGLGILVVAMCLFITGEILSRLLFNYSFLGVVELVEQLVVILAYLSIAAVQKERKHITVDILPEKLRARKAGPILDCILLAVSASMMAFMFVEVIWFLVRAYKMNSTTTTLFWPVWPFILVMAIGILMMIMRLAMQLKNGFSKARMGKSLLLRKKGTT